MDTVSVDVPTLRSEEMVMFLSFLIDVYPDPVKMERICSMQSIPALPDGQDQWQLAYQFDQVVSTAGISSSPFEPDVKKANMGEEEEASDDGFIVVAPQMPPSTKAAKVAVAAAVYPPPLPASMQQNTDSVLPEQIRSTDASTPQGGPSHPLAQVRYCNFSSLFLVSAVD
jgi:hypothetical protein